MPTPMPARRRRSRREMRSASGWCMRRTSRWGQARHESGMFRGTEAGGEDSPDAGHVAGEQSGRVEPQTGKDLRAKDAVRAGRQIDIGFISVDEPEDAPLPQGDDNVF